MGDYVERNRLWLSPLIICLMLSMTPDLLTNIGPTASLPNWINAVSLILAGLAGFAAGIGAVFTRTTSAEVVRYLSCACAFAGIIVAIFK